MDPTENPNPAPTPTPDPAPNQNPAPASDQKWWTGFADETNRGFAESKNWRSPEDAVKGFKHLETLLGTKSNAIMVPGDSATPEEWNAFYDKAGRPGAPENYALPDTLKDDEGLKAFTGVAHKLGLNSKQFEGAAAWVAEQRAANEAAGIAEASAKSDAALAELKKENPGLAYDKFIEQGRRGLKEMGLAPDELADIERAAGTKPMLKLLARIGEMNGEIPFVEGTAVAGAISPEAARIQIANFQKDKNWMKAWSDGDADKIKAMNNLHKAAAGGAKS